MHSHKKNQLRKGAKWMKIIVDADPNDGADLDTYANFLYRLGRKNEAVILEQKAVKLSPSETEIKANLDKMKNGMPTWPTN